MKIVREVDETIVGVFAAAYRGCRQASSRVVFDRLFPGRRSELSADESRRLAELGHRGRSAAPGKNVRKLSLLSGGERSLVALAFLFAIFRSRPSPFYLLDEVEAALDDINLLASFAGARAGDECPDSDRDPPEAHHGGRRRSLRRDDEGGRLQRRGKADGGRRLSGPRGRDALEYGAARALV